MQEKIDTTTLFVGRIEDARYLLDVLANGDIGPCKLPGFDPADTEVLHAMTLQTDLDQVYAAARAKFDEALRRVLKAMAPLTIQSLKDTDDRFKVKPWWWLKPIYRAKRLTIALVVFSFLFVTAAIVGEVWGKQFSWPDHATSACMRLIWNIIESLTPFTYGALGAAVYLLRWLHIHVYERTFDRRRRPEYFNRVLLGSIAGGAIVMFVDQIVDDKGNVVALSAAALGFLAGYNTDLLFSAIERITFAILPKVGIDSVRRREEVAAMAAAEAAALTLLTEQLTRATDPAERTRIMALIEKFAPRK